ncbi:MAG: ring-cleaving dioxygenase [Opitutaceae bacterium]|nr:ring-cleaving dioxygenase [Opitutaceae bacterium]
MQLTGFHHLTAVTADAARNHAFYTQTLGLRLVKKTVNQDDVSAYHLFYADGVASPGSDITFFDWPAKRERRGTRSVVRTGLRVATEASLEWWRSRFEMLKVAHAPITQRGGRAVLDFEDPEGQRLALTVDDTAVIPHRWKKSPVRAEHQIIGLGPIAMSVPELAPTERVLTAVLNMKRTAGYAWNQGGAERETHVFQMSGEGPQAELHVVVEPDAAPAGPGAGGVHHVAFRTPSRETSDAWAARLAEIGLPSSGPIDRFYFRSLYFREPGGVLFEIATDGPGFAADEPLDELGEKLALPPFLEPRRAEIERGLKPLVTK